jgi:hypothetical protein
MKDPASSKGEQPIRKDSHHGHKEKRQNKDHPKFEKAKKPSNDVNADKKGQGKDKKSKGKHPGHLKNGAAAAAAAANKVSSPTKTQLEEAIYALGGDEEDYLLIKNVDEDESTQDMKRDSRTKDVSSGRFECLN